MIKKIINYTDFDGNEVQEDAWFHLTKTAIAKLAFKYADGDDAEAEDENRNGLVKYLEQLLANNDRVGLIDFYREIILDSYGKRDGKKFIQNKETREEFEYSAAFDDFFFDLITNEEAGIDEFMDGLYPKDMVTKEQIAEAKAKAAELIKTNA